MTTCSSLQEHVLIKGDINVQPIFSLLISTFQFIISFLILCIKSLYKTTGTWSIRKDINKEPILKYQKSLREIYLISSVESRRRQTSQELCVTDPSFRFPTIQTQKDAGETTRCQLRSIKESQKRNPHNWE